MIKLEFRKILLIVALIISVFSVYGPAFHFNFVNYDDPAYVSNNETVKEGISLKNVIWAFTTFSNSNWHPLTWLSHMLDVTLFGLNAGYHHLINVVIHTCNTLLLFCLFYLVTHHTYKSLILAAFFGLHPIHVESVAWISERKDLLCAFFWLSAMVAYYRYTQKPSPERYLISFILFIFGALSKPMMVTFPFVLLLFDYWPLNRYLGSDRISHYHFTKSPWVWLIIEKIPMMLVTIIISYVALLSQSKGGSIAELPIMVRFANAVISYLIYLKKMIWPGELAVIYPFQTPSLWLAAAGFIAIVCILIISFTVRNKYPYVLVGFLWFFGTLVPVIGFIQVGSQALADRYTYIPSIGFFVAVIWGGASLIKQLIPDKFLKKVIITIVTMTALTLMMLLSYSQVRYWENSVTLMTNAVRVTENNYIAHENLGLALSELGLHDKALFHFNQVITINPDYAPAYMNIGSYYLLHKQYNKAVSFYQKTISLDPSLVRSYALMGKALSALGKQEKAAMYFEKVRQLSPGEESLQALRKFEQSEKD
ncbi:MAG: tetratricopeptide repeat protein [Desulfobacteraceae bacterium]|jgi:hypothetical protein|nr:tetratricopeptide repeat protein [Desulfobacteraceae bacterium]